MHLVQSLSNASLVANLGSGAFSRGRTYAREGRVLLLHVDQTQLLLRAVVSGSGPEDYDVEVELDPDPPFAHHGYCSCPLGGYCKHVVAALLKLREEWTSAPPAEPASTKGWESDLAGLVGQADLDPRWAALGLRLETVPSGSGFHVQCRPVRRSPSTGRWVQTGAAWSDVIYDYGRRFPLAQVQLFKRLRHAADVASLDQPYGYSSAYGAAWLRLDAAEENLWPVLDRLVASGVAVVGPTDKDPVRLTDRRLEVVIDVATASSGDLLVRPLLRDDDLEIRADALSVIGNPGHGLALRRAEHGRTALELSRLANPIDTGLAQWLAAGTTVTVPAADRDRFLQAFYPALRRQVLVVSDGSVELPEPVAPAVRLTVHHPAPEQIELSWAVGYGPTGAGPEFPVDDLASDPGGRDARAERELWSGLAPVLDRAPSEVLDPGQPGRPRSAAVLTGLTAAEFSSEFLAELERAGVDVVHSGDRLDYRRAAGPPQVTVSTQEGEGGADWFDLHIEVSVNAESVPFVLLFRALAEGAAHLILPSGLYFSLDQPEFAQLAELIGEARAVQDRERTGLRIHVQQSGLWDELVRLGVVGTQAARWQTRVAALAMRESPTEIAPPIALAAELRPYQQQGYQWLHQLWSLGIGGILADDMGLGKTLQALALIAKVAEDATGPATPFLVVAPTSVLTTWVHEAAHFAPGLRVVQVQQTEAKRPTPLAELAAGADVVVTSYTLLRLDAEAYAAVPWRGLVLDEAQFAKNHQAKTYGAIRRLGIDFTIAMTGTPLENSLMDLWAMLSLTAPGMFPSPERFSEYFRRPIERNAHPERLGRLRDRIAPVMLRRTKDEVATELPAKQEQVVEVDLHPRHARIYSRQLQRERQKILGLIGDLDANRFTILRSLTLLRQLSLDAALVDDEHEDVPSAKIDLLLEMITSLVAEGHRALVFSQFTRFLKRVGDRLSSAGVDYAYLDGQTRQRARVIDDFKTGTAGVFLISLKAGGFGLNLTEADYCFVLDPWWNPASEAQAVDRAHRIGQTRPVMVYRLVSKDTIEDKVMQLKSKKQQLFDQVISADAMPAGAFSPDEIRALLAG